MINLVNIPVQAGDRLVVPGDWHFPLHDPRASDLFIAAVQDLQATIAFLLGDTFDTWSLSKHSKSADHLALYEGGALEHEASVGKPYLAAFRAALVKRPNGGQPQAYIGPGNHEDRVYDLIDENPGLRGLEWHDPFKDALHGWHTLPRNFDALLANLVITHGDTLDGWGTKTPARAVLERQPGQNTLFGHTHRIDRAVTTTWPKGRAKEHGAWNIGHLQDVDKVNYMHRTKWRLGFAVVDFWQLEDKQSRFGYGLGFTVTQHEILRIGKKQVLHSPLTGRTYR